MTLLYVQIVKRSEEDFVVHCVSVDKRNWFLLPEDTQDLKFHTSLSSKKPLLNAVYAIKNVNGYRTIGVKIDDDIKKEYFDESSNICFRELPLEECLPKTIPCRPTDTQSELEDHIKRLEMQLKINSEQNEIKLHHIEKKFILEPFDKKQSDPIEWLRRFEEECCRFQIKSDNLKIQALRFYLINGPANDWYENNLKKIGLNDSWGIWRDSFKNIFVDKGWSLVKRALGYKYLGGSLVDYALTKERLLLDIEPKGTEISRINQIVFGLPNEAQLKLDREKICNLYELYSKLRKLEDAFIKKKEEKLSNPKSIVNPALNYYKKGEPQHKSNYQRKPCSHCETLGFHNRYHLMSECRNKNKTPNQPKINQTDLDLSEIDLDSEHLN